MDDFLSITAIKAGGNILNLSSANLRPLLEDVIQELRLDIEAKRLTITYPHDMQNWPDMNIDTGKIREALLIILENAVRYNNEGGTIIIETKADKDGFELTVKDSGLGITAEDKEKIFSHLFHRGDNARKANPIGMGVGLSVARAITRAHHGDLNITSEGTGKGTTVTIRVPLNSFDFPHSV